MKGSKLLFICIAIFFCSCSKEKKYWDAVVKYNTIESYKSYISNFPNGKYKNKADSCIQVLVWNDAKKTNNFESYESYLKNYPKGYYKLIADSLFEETLWNYANNSNDMELYLKYENAFPKGKYIFKTSYYINRYLIGVNHAGFFKVGMPMPKNIYNGFNINVIKEEYYSEGGSNFRTRYYAYEGNEKVIELIEKENKVFRIDIYSKKFKTKYNMGVNSSISDFIEKYPKYIFYSTNINCDDYKWYEYLVNFYIRVKGENGIRFQIASENYIGKYNSTSYPVFESNDFKNDSRINIVNIYQGEINDKSFDKEKVDATTTAKLKANEIAKDLNDERERKREIRSNQSNSTYSNNSNMYHEGYQFGVALQDYGGYLGMPEDAWKLHHSGEINSSWKKGYQAGWYDEAVRNNH